MNNSEWSWQGFIHPNFWYAVSRVLTVVVPTATIVFPSFLLD